MGMRPETLIKAEAVVDRVGEGASLRQALMDIGLSTSAFGDALASVGSLALKYSRIREVLADAMVDDARLIADDPNIDPQRARNMLDIRKWTASKHHARVYGDRIDLNVVQQLSVLDAMNAARGRLLPPMCDPVEAVDAEVIPAIADNTATAPDVVSDALASLREEPPDADIFS